MKGLFFVVFLSVCYAASYPRVEVDFYVMSKCPYASQFVTSFYETVYSMPGLPSIMDITMNYIASVDPTQPSGFSSKHGPTEVQGDLLELCSMHVPAPNRLSWFELVNCAYNNYTSVPQILQPCSKSVGIDFSKLQACAPTAIAKQYMITSINATNSLGWNPTLSPTVYVNKQCIYGPADPPCSELDPTSNQVLQLICSLYAGPQPQGCSSDLIQ
eukprot:TRINITY_DN7153_c0_g1_i1.p1 TRINITY_DN7153_c0_g1~~TRINITY_DN7153_c0_g1_i1.p1  ORF type:complete len:215 (+),score=30.62 TRINITY_DN7153_c0_g1_i1:103-747(+)